jgi:hypothetical protein
LDTPVALYEWGFKIFSLDNPKDTLLVLIIASIALIYYELAVIVSPLFMIVFIFYNFYFKREFVRPEVNYVKNMRFI